MAIDFTEPSAAKQYRFHQMIIHPRQKLVEIEFVDRNGQSRVGEAPLGDVIAAIRGATSLEDFNDKVETFFINNVLGGGTIVPD